MAGETIIVRQGLRGIKGDKGDPGPAGRDGTGVVPSAGQVVAGGASGSTVNLGSGQYPKGDGTNVVAGTFETDVAATAAVARINPGSDGADGQFAVWDSSVGHVGWFQGPVLVANWAPYKANGDDLTLVGAKVQQFLDTLSSTKIPGVLLPGLYRMDTIPKPGSNTTLYLYGATLLQYNTALGDGTPGGGQSNLLLANVQNVTITGGVLDGRKASIAGTTENKHGVEIRGDCQHITVRDIVTQQCKGDGYFVGRWTEAAPYAIPRDIVFENIRATGNHRQACSVTHGRDITFIDPIFESTSGTSPQAGLDIEPNNANETVYNLTFVRPVLRNNAGAGFLTNPGATGTLGSGVLRGRFTFYKPTITGNGGPGVNHTHGDDCFLDLPYIAQNGLEGIYVLPTNGRTVSRFRVRGGTIEQNQRDGVAWFGGAGLGLFDAELDGVRIVQNGKDGSGTKSGVNLGVSDTAPITRPRITRCQLGDPDNTETQYAGARIGGDHVTGAIITDNRFGNYVNRRLSGYAANRVAVIRDNQNVVTRNGGVASVANGGTISHGLGDGPGGFTPTRYGATATAANRRVAITAVSTTTLTISLTDGSGTAITAAENVAWWAEV